MNDKEFSKFVEKMCEGPSTSKVVSQSILKGAFEGVGKVLSILIKGK